MRVFLFFAILTLASPPPRRVVLESVRRGEEILVVYGARDEASGLRIRELAENAVPRRSGSTRLVEAAEVGRDDLARGSLALIGTPSSNPWIGRLARDLPFGIDEKGIELDGKTFEDSGDSLQLLYPNPLRSTSPLFVVTGNSDEAVIEALTRRRRGDFHVRRRGRTLLLGRFGEAWKLAPDRTRELRWAAEPALASPHGRFFVHGFVPEDLEASASRFERARGRVEALFGPVSARQDFHLYESLEHKGLATDDTRVAHEEQGALHAVLGLGSAPERLAVERLLPRRLSSVIRGGLASLFTEEEATLDELEDRSRRLLATNDPPRLDSLDEASPFVSEAVSASFVRFVSREHGLDALTTELDLHAREKDWRAALAEKPPAPFASRAAPSSFLRGFTYAHEGYDIENGYLSARSDRSLEKLRSLGVDSVAIVPFAFLRDPKATEPLAIPTRPGSETDEAVIHAIRKARSLGMTVLLKPQIWLRGSWPGEIAPSDERVFFREYGRWMRHYALMAERNGVELLAIGTELSKLTGGRRSAWEGLIRDLRSLYGGGLVYAANWGMEVEHVEFWPLLDFIGVDFYYPLSDEDDPSDAELRAAFEKWLDELEALARRHGKAVLLTEIGYASTRSPWKSPHASDRERQVSGEHQARAYEAAFAALADETDWIRGAYWWEWPSDLEIGGADHRGFTPNGKPAEEVVRRWYRDRLGSSSSFEVPLQPR